MYSQNPTHFNTVFLITFIADFLPCQGVFSRRFPLLGGARHQATALTLAIRIAQKTRQESRIAAQT
ncbi:hypothetical protein ABIE12_003412 [Serratia sp. 509]